MDILTNLANRFGTDKGTAEYPRHNYTSIYDRYFRRFRGDFFNLLEIGVKDARFPGASIKMWQQYFPKAMIYGFDKASCKQFENSRVKIYRGDQGDREDLGDCMHEFGVKFRFIIDDGSHVHKHQIMTLALLFPYIEPGGLYFIEDLHARCSKGTRGLFRHIIRGSKIDLPMEKYEQDYLYRNMRDCRFFCNRKLLLIRKKA